MKKIKKFVNHFVYCGFSAIKIIFFILILKLRKIHSTHIRIKIKNKKIGKEKLIIRPFTTDLRLVKMLLENDGEYDFLYKEEYLWIKDAKLIIDAGANIGIFSRIIKELSKNALIIAIEPEKNNFELLQENLKYDNIICKKNGLWNKKCNLVIIPSERGEWGFTVRETIKNENVDVEAIGIEDILKEFNLEYIDILKIDIEGSEVELFDERADKWINKVKMCIIEFHERKRPGSSKKIIETMKNNGFKYEIFEENYIFTNTNVNIQ